MRCLEKDPKNRYANAGELLHDLDAVSLQQVAARRYFQRLSSTEACSKKELTFSASASPSLL